MALLAAFLPWCGIYGVDSNIGTMKELTKIAKIYVSQTGIRVNGKDIPNSNSYLLTEKSAIEMRDSINDLVEAVTELQELFYQQPTLTIKKTMTAKAIAKDPLYGGPRYTVAELREKLDFFLEGKPYSALSTRMFLGLLEDEEQS